MDNLRRVTVALRVGATALVLVCPPSAANSSDTAELLHSLWTVAPGPSDLVRQMPEVPTRWISFETTEGTLMNVDVSPDGKTLIFDLLGDLYQLPIEGGDAVPLTTGMAWDQAPRFSPDGSHVYFVSDRVGYKNLWRLTLVDRSLRQITNLDRDIRGGPNWSKRANQLIVGIEGPGLAVTDKILHYIDPASGAVTPINSPEQPRRDPTTGKRLRNMMLTYSGVESPDGEIFFSQPRISLDFRNRVDRLYSFDRSRQTGDSLTPDDATYNEYKPQISHNGKWLAYHRQYDDKRTELRILNRTTGQDDCLIGLDDADGAQYFEEDSRPNYAFTPDDRSIVFWHDGKIQRVTIADASVQSIPFRVAVEREIVERVKPPARQIGAVQDRATIRWPSLSSDGQTMVFAAIGYVWVMNMRSGDIRRLTDSNDLEFMPAISPNGRAVAYTSFSKSDSEDDKYGAGRLMVADVHNRKTREVLTDADADYLLPRWSSDGSKIAMIKIQRQGLPGSRMQGFGWTPATSGSFREVVSVPLGRGLLRSNHSLFIGFDATDDGLLFSYSESNTSTALFVADLAGKNVQALTVGSPDVASITPAPDLKHLALTLRDDSVWVVPFSVESGRSTVSSLASDAYRISNDSGFYPNWNDVGHLTFGFGTSVYKYLLEDEGLQTLDITLPIAGADPIQNMAFRGVRLITVADASGAGPVIENGTVVTSGNRIVAIGPTDSVAIPADALVIDASGKTVVPGFLDTHYHRLGGVSAYGLPHVPSFDDDSALEFGITSAWDPSSTVDVAPAGADLQLAGRTAGPRWAFSGAVMNYPHSVYLSSGFLSHYAQALAGAESRGNLGATVLKESSAHVRRWRRWFVAAARESGLGIVAHLEDFDGTMTRIVDGYTGGDHASLPAPFYKDVQELLNRTGFIWTPNVMLMRESNDRLGDAHWFFCDAVFQTGNRIYREKLDGYPSVCNGMQRSDSASYEIHRVSRIAKQVAHAASAGATIGVSAHNMPGANLHMEMWYLWKGGMPIEGVLRATTMNNAEKLGLQEEIGSLEAGKIADFLILDENPLDDILNTLSLRYTVQGGVVYDSATAQQLDPATLAEAANDEDASPPRFETGD